MQYNMPADRYLGELSVFKETTDRLVDATVRCGQSKRAGSLAGIIDELTRKPLTGVPILLLVLYFGLYQTVGKFAAETMVDYLDKFIFGQIINPILKKVIAENLSYEWLVSLLVGDYGIITLGLRYAAAIVLPVVAVFFLLFAVLEDSGYLPRLALLVNNILKLIGLNGRAAIPFTLGFGCGTMAVIVARTLESRRDRLIATLLLALAVPCSAQLVLVLALLSSKPTVLILWCGIVLSISMFAGVLAARIIPGSPAYFYLELPQMRVPMLENVIFKAYTRIVNYFFEILPIFIIVSLILWSADRTGILAEIIRVVKPLTVCMGLPQEFSKIFVLGFFRRDYGAAGLYDMFCNNQLTEHQLLVAAVFLTLFMPCIAQCAVMYKECGLIPASMIVGLIAAIAFASGLLTNLLF